ncbi:hypothetical protein ACSSNL_18080 [Thalassobius sp. S69A]|uniref:hypothetical protein n=1 Tax=unclassified Thalassovita TaxID=2619711 RepID=UPI003C7E8F47
MLEAWRTKKKSKEDQAAAAKIVTETIRREMTTSRDRLKEIVEQMAERKKKNA